MEIFQYGYRMGYLPMAKINLESIFKLSTPTIFVQNQEERDYLGGLQLMYGEPLRILTEDQWFQMMRMRQIQMHYDHSMMGIALPITFFATYQVSQALITTRM